ncbi:MAG TPA: tail fiber protein [Pyrinomonadaceae bacterium]|jgi:microcystin-dependent protein
MGEPFVGEIRMFAGNFAPNGWMFCEGQLLPISENETLFQLIGTTYGGDGESTFALPDLRGRVPIHQGTGSGLSSYILGENGGVEEVTLTVNQIPIHTHPALCVTSGGSASSDPTNGLWQNSDSLQYSNLPADAFMGANPIMTSVTGGSQPHENEIPYLCVNYIISLFGVFPQPN